MKSNALHFIFASVIACGLCLGSHAAGAKTNVAEKAVAVAIKAKAAAGKGYAAAQFRYAEMLRDGRGMVKNMREAARWTRKAADADHAHAQCQMGLFYMNGLGVDKDEDKAVKQDYADAQYNLAKLYLNSQHPTSREQGAGHRAISLLRRAAAQGNARAKEMI